MTTYHQLKQKSVVNQIELQVRKNSLTFSTVQPVVDYEKDARISLTSVHFPSNNLIQKIQREIVAHLIKAEPGFYYYPKKGYHMTIKNVRVINDPPHFTKHDVSKVSKVFFEIIPNARKFKVFFLPIAAFPQQPRFNRNF